MRVGKSEESKIIVQIKTVRRGGEKDGKRKGMFIYETEESIDVFEATPQQVIEAVVNGLKSASNKK